MEKREPGSSQEVQHERTKGNTYKLQKGKLQLFQLDKRGGKKLVIRVVKHCSMLLREDLPSLELFKI